MLRVRSCKNHPKSGSGRRSAFLGTCSYGGGTGVVGVLGGVLPCSVVVRCRSVGVGVHTGGRRLASAGHAPVAGNFIVRPQNRLLR